MTSARFDIAGRTDRRGPLIRSIAAVAGHDALLRMLPAVTFAIVLLLGSAVVRLVETGIPAPLAVLIASVPALLAARGTLLVAMLVDDRDGD